MTSRERIITALNHKEPDKVPFDLDGFVATGIHRIAYKNLLFYLGIKKENVYIYDFIQQLARVEESILRRLKVDTRKIFPNAPSNWKMDIKEERNYKYFIDEYGITWRTPEEKELYYDQIGFPLKDTRLENLEKYPWPNPSDISRIKGLKKSAKFLGEKNYLVTMDTIAGGFFEMGFRLRGYENFYYDLGSNPKYACALMDKCLKLEMEYWDLVLSSELRNYIDVVWTANDLGTQDGPMISPEMFRKYIKPRMRKLNSFIKKKKSDVFIFFHSCGSVYESIPDFIETGIDILNPVQVSAKDMNTKRLKKEFGKDIVFWGGGVDTQKILPYGSPQQVKDEVKRRIDDLAPGGGFIFAAVHNIQPDVPPENIMAMWETLQEYGKY